MGTNGHFKEGQGWEQQLNLMTEKFSFQMFITSGGGKTETTVVKTGDMTVWLY